MSIANGLLNFLLLELSLHQRFLDFKPNQQLFQAIYDTGHQNLQFNFNKKQQDPQDIFL